MYITLRAGTPLRVVRLQREGMLVRWTKLQRWNSPDDKSVEAKLDVGGFTEVEPSATDLANPWLSLAVAEPSAPTTWSLIPLSARSDDPWDTAIMAIPREDTGLLRTGRWQVRSSLAAELPAALSSIQRGAWTGMLDWPRES